MYFTKATAGCKTVGVSVSHLERRLSYSGVASHLRPHVLAPPRADHDNVVTIRGRYLGTLPGCELRELITNCLSFVRTIPWSLIGLIRRTAAMWSVNLVIRVATSGAIWPWKHGADNGPETGATESRPHGEKAFPTRSTGFLKHFDFFWFYVDWTKRDQLIFSYLHFKRRQKDFLFPFECVGLLTDGEVNSKSKLSMRICWA